MRHRVRLCAAGAALVVAATGLVAPTQAVAAERDGNGDAATRRIVAAMARDLGLTGEQAERRLAAQEAVAGLDARLADQLGADFGGAWFDGDTGRLLVGVTSAGQAAEVRQAGATPVVVAYGLDELMGIIDNLNKTVRAGAVLGWHVDPRRNAVVVTVRKGQAAPAAVSRHGDAVRIEETADAPRLTADTLEGGEQIAMGAGLCSAGFNLRAGATRYILTAGHCRALSGVVQVAGPDGTGFGPFVGFTFPGNDYAIARNDNPAYWQQVPTVHGYGAASLLMWGARSSPVGTAICKSGRTTGLTCGVVDGLNETVLYPEGEIFGLTRHSACSEGGDSGGANVSTFGNPFLGRRSYAEGLTNGGRMRFDPASGVFRCLSFFGERNVSYFQPVQQPLAEYGVSFGAGLMTVVE
jgi:streptogrisin C